MGWDISSFDKRVEYQVDTLRYSSILYNVSVVITLDSSLSIFIQSPIDVAFVINGQSVEFYSLNISKLEFLVLVPEITPDGILTLLVYYDRFNTDHILPETKNDLKFFVYSRIYHSYYWHPSNSYELVYDAYDTNSLKGSYTQTSLSTLTNYGNYFCYYTSIWFYVDSANVGTWLFAVDGDDAVEVAIDGSVVVGWYGDHGMCNCVDHNNTIDLSEGWHCLVARHENGTGGQGLAVHCKPPSSSTWYPFSTLKFRCFRIEHSDSFVKNRKFIANGYQDVLLPFLYNILPDLDVFNRLGTVALESAAGNDFVNNNAALSQPVCSHTGVKTDKYISSYVYVPATNVHTFSILFFAKVIEGGGSSRLISINNSSYLTVQSDGSLIYVDGSTTYQLNYRIDFNKCISISIICNGTSADIIYNGQVIYTIYTPITANTVYLGGYSANNSCTAYFFYFFKFGYVPPSTIDYIHNSFLGPIIQKIGYDTSAEFTSLTLWPYPVFVNDATLLLVEGDGYTKYSIYDYSSSSYIVHNADAGLNYQTTFNTSGIIKLNLQAGSISKDYNVKVNTATDDTIEINNYIDFGTYSNNGLEDINSYLYLPNATLFDIIDTITEYGYSDNNNISFLNVPTETYMYAGIFTNVVDVDVEYNFDVDTDAYYFNIPSFLKLANLYSHNYLYVPCSIVFSDSAADAEDIPVYFSSAYWKYFDYNSEIMVSLIAFSNAETYMSIQDGLLHRYPINTIVSNEVYYELNTSSIVSVSGALENFYNVDVISGTLNRYFSDIMVSTFDNNDTHFNVKLNTIFFEDFSIDLNDVIDKVSCYSVEVKDTYYGIEETSIKVWYEGTSLSGITTSSISDGFKVGWCYDLFTDISREYYSFIVEAKNNYGDTGIQSFYIKRGYRYRYNPYHLTVHDYNELIPILITAENNTYIYPSFSAENLITEVENMPYRGLCASVTPIMLNRIELQSSITALSSNFYPGGEYEIKINCEDNEGNIMPEFTFRFKIRDDGT